MPPYPETEAYSQPEKKTLPYAHAPIFHYYVNFCAELNERQQVSVAAILKRAIDIKTQAASVELIIKITFIITSTMNSGMRK